MNFSEAPERFYEKSCFQKLHNIRRKFANLQLYSKEISTQVFFLEYCECFKSTYVEEHLLTATFDLFETATEQRCAAASVLTLTLN